MITVFTAADSCDFSEKNKNDKIGGKISKFSWYERIVKYFVFIFIFEILKFPSFPDRNYIQQMNVLNAICTGLFPPTLPNEKYAIGNRVNLMYELHVVWFCTRFDLPCQEKCWTTASSHYMDGHFLYLAIKSVSWKYLWF